MPLSRWTHTFILPNQRHDGSSISQVNCFALGTLAICMGDHRASPQGTASSSTRHQQVHLFIFLPSAPNKVDFGLHQPSRHTCGFCPASAGVLSQPAETNQGHSTIDLAQIPRQGTCGPFSPCSAFTTAQPSQLSLLCPFAGKHLRPHPISPEPQPGPSVSWIRLIPRGCQWLWVGQHQPWRPNRWLQQSAPGIGFHQPGTAICQLAGGCPRPILPD